MPKTPQIELSHESFQLLISRMGLSKKALSEALGLSEWAASHWSRGDVVKVPIKHWQAIRGLLIEIESRRMQSRTTHAGALSLESMKQLESIESDADSFLEALKASEPQSEQAARGGFDLRSIPTSELLKELERRTKK